MKNRIALLRLYIDVARINLSRVGLHLEIFLLRLAMLKSDFLIGYYSALEGKKDTCSVKM